MSQRETSYQVSPYRFTDRPNETIAFFEAVGLRAEASRDGWADLVGAGGRVGVHPLATASASGKSTTLCLVTPSAAEAVDQLRLAGRDARWWDEAFGRQAAVLGPHADLTINEPMTDFHGHRRHDITSPAGLPEVTVVAVCHTSDLRGMADFFATFGFRGDRAHDLRRPLRAGDTSGAIVLHPSEHPPVPGDACTLAFETTEEIPTLAQRLRTLGYPVVEHHPAGATPQVEVTDPDGNQVEIRRRA